MKTQNKKSIKPTRIVPILFLIVILLLFMLTLYSFHQTNQNSELKEEISDMLVLTTNINIYTSNKLNITSEEFYDGFLKDYSSCLLNETCKKYIKDE